LDINDEYGDFDEKYNNNKYRLDSVDKTDRLGKIDAQMDR
jgi:hypothetical protein